MAGGQSDALPTPAIGPWRSRLGSREVAQGGFVGRIMMPDSAIATMDWNRIKHVTALARASAFRQRKSEKRPNSTDKAPNLRQCDKYPPRIFGTSRAKVWRCRAS